MENHKKVLGILFVVTAAIQIIFMSFLSLLFTTIFAFAIRQASPEDAEVLEFVTTIVRYVPGFVIIFISVPTLIAGIGLLSKQKWGLIFALIMGCLKLFSFPFGTAIGIYAIWIYSEEQRILKANPGQL